MHGSPIIKWVKSTQRIYYNLLPYIRESVELFFAKSEKLYFSFVVTGKDNKMNVFILIHIYPLSCQLGLL